MDVHTRAGSRAAASSAISTGAGIAGHASSVTAPVSAAKIYLQRFRRRGGAVTRRASTTGYRSGACRRYRVSARNQVYGLDQTQLVDATVPMDRLAGVRRHPSGHALHLAPRDEHGRRPDVLLERGPQLDFYIELATLTAR
ncbi:MAG: hypothetical protein WKG01_34100 [Kofleriaceae bacterium]